MIKCYTLYNKKGVVEMKPMRVESIEAFFGVPLLEALYEEYLYEWSVNAYSKDEIGTVSLALMKDQLDEEDFLDLPVSFVNWFFDIDDPFPITTHGKVGYNWFCRVLYEEWLNSHLPRKGE